MRLNQVTVTLPDLDEGWAFYRALGLIPIVDARPRYARFVCPDSDSTFSLHQGQPSGGGTTVYFECDHLDDEVARLKAAGVKSQAARRTRPGCGAKLNCSIPEAIGCCSSSPAKTVSTPLGEWRLNGSRSQLSRRRDDAP
jgi:predicted enzyme related to lactoylglutathione lyase